jgi:SlyX protein
MTDLALSEMVEKLQQRVESLEIASGYQQDVIEALQESVGKQYQEIQQLNYKLDLLSNYLKSLREQEIKTANEEVPPPHY